MRKLKTPEEIMRDLNILKPLGALAMVDKIVIAAQRDDLECAAQFLYESGTINKSMILNLLPKE